MPIIPVNGLSLHAQEMNPAGGRTVVLIHGLFSNLAVYYFHIAPLLAQHHHVVMYDLRSHGLSQSVTTGYGLDTMADDFLALLDACGLNEVDVVGYSFGGLVALNCAIRFPNRVGKVAVIDAPDPADQRARDIIDIYSREFLENYLTNVADTTRMRMGKRQFEKNHRKYTFLFHQTSIKADMLADEHFLSEAPLGRIASCLLLYGRSSNCLHTGYALRERIGNARLKILEGDHNLPVQQPEQVGRALADFLTYIPITHG